MTRKEAIEALTHCVDWAEHFDDTYADSVPVEALQIALEALGMRNIRCKEKLIVDIRYGFDTYPLEIDMKKLPRQIAFNYLINCRPGPISWLEVTIENKDLKETGIYRHPIIKEK